MQSGKTRDNLMRSRDVLLLLLVVIVGCNRVVPEIGMIYRKDGILLITDVCDESIALKGEIADSVVAILDYANMLSHSHSWSLIERLETPRRPRSEERRVGNACRKTR